MRLMTGELRKRGQVIKWKIIQCQRVLFFLFIAAEQSQRLPAGSLTDPNVQFSRIRFFR